MTEMTKEEECLADFLARHPFEEGHGYSLDGNLFEKMFLDNEGKSWLEQGYSIESLECQVYYDPERDQLRVSANARLTGETTFAVTRSLAIKINHIREMHEQANRDPNSPSVSEDTVKDYALNREKCSECDGYPGRVFVNAHYTQTEEDPGLEHVSWHVGLICHECGHRWWERYTKDEVTAKKEQEDA